LVGWGTKQANGCTSGHGVCGLPRLAPRSLIAVPTFMAAGFAIATLRYNLDILYGGPNFGTEYIKVWKWIAFAIIIGFNGYSIMIIKQQAAIRKELGISYLVGAIFGLGLVISGMCRVSKILGFLTLNTNWDPSLMFVMMSAVVINFFTFKTILSKPKPKEAEKFAFPKTGTIDAKLIIGSILFGAGWGLSGLCPGPGAIVMFTKSEGILWVISLALG